MERRRRALKGAYAPEQEGVVKRAHKGCKLTSGKEYAYLGRNPSPPIFTKIVFRYKDVNQTSISGTAVPFTYIVYNPNSLFKHNSTAANQETFPYLGVPWTNTDPFSGGGWGGLYDRALVVRAKYHVTFTNPSATTPYRAFIAFNPYNDAGNPPAVTWPLWDLATANGTNNFWCRSCILGYNTIAQGCQELSHSMYLPSQYGDEEAYLSTVQNGNADFGNVCPATVQPTKLLQCYIGWLPMSNTTATENIPVSVTAELTTFMSRVTLATK